MTSAGNGYKRTKMLQRVVDAKKMYISTDDSHLIHLALDVLEKEIKPRAQYNVKTMEGIERVRQKLFTRSERIRRAKFRKD